MTFQDVKAALSDARRKVSDAKRAVAGIDPLLRDLPDGDRALKRIERCGEKARKACELVASAIAQRDKAIEVFEAAIRESRAVIDARERDLEALRRLP